MNVLISIIIPCYNHGKYIQDAIDSVLKQTFQDFEIIVIDDGSNDKLTQKVLSEISHSRLKIFRLENKGVSNARNFGIKSSVGQYILLLDADDIIRPTFLEKSLSILKSNPLIKTVTADVMLFGRKKGGYHLPKFTLEKLIAQNVLVITSLFRRADFDKTLGFNVNMKNGFEDWDFWISLLKTGGDVYRIPEYLILYRIIARSRNRSISDEMQSILREQIYLNHQDVFMKFLLNPIESFEYQNIINSKEYLLGRFILKPIRSIFFFLKL